LDPLKKCSKCGELKPRAEFGKNAHQPDGLRYYCKPCTSGVQKAQRDKYKAQNAVQRASFVRLYNAPPPDEFDIDVVEPSPEDESAQKAQARADAARARLESDHATLHPGDLGDDYTAPNYDREKKQEYNETMGEFAGSVRELGEEPEKLAAFVSLTAEQERRWINKRLARSVSLGAARDLLFARQFEQIAARVKWPIRPSGFAARPKHSPTRRAIVGALSDLHFGSILPGYENPVAYDFLRASRSLAHVGAAMAEFKTQYRDHTECVLGWNGDEFEGLLGHNDIDNAPLSEQMVAVAQAAVALVTFLAAHFPRVRVYKRPGNHGRNKLRHPGRATSSKWDNFETVVFKFVAMQCASLPNVSFDISRSPVAVIPLFDKHMLMLHADTELNLKSPSSSGGKASWGRALQVVNADRRYGVHIDLLQGGHFHDPTIMYFDHGVAVCQGALTPTNGYARTGGYESVTGQFIYEATPGFAFGDSRFIRTGAKQYEDASLDTIIPAFDFDSIGSQVTP
jgi:hypothetical protein